MRPVADAGLTLSLDFQLALAGATRSTVSSRGGMGVVYLAREVHLDRLVAIKLLPPEKSVIPTLRDRFLREARLAAKLSHPHIIPIHSVDEVEGFVFYVMAFVDGETLAQRVRSAVLCPHPRERACYARSRGRSRTHTRRGSCIAT
jgi:serine/threonine protein kinase